MLCLSGFELYSRWVPLNDADDENSPNDNNQVNDEGKENDVHVDDDDDDDDV